MSKEKTKSPERVHLTAVDESNSVEQRRSEELPTLVPPENAPISGSPMLRQTGRLRHTSRRSGHVNIGLWRTDMLRGRTGRLAVESR